MELQRASIPWPHISCYTLHQLPSIQSLHLLPCKVIPSLHTTSLGPWTEIQEFAHGWTKGPTTGRRVKEMYNSWMFYLAFWESSSFCNVCASMYNLFHVVTLIASYQWPKWIETNGYKWWVGDWSKYQWHAESTSQPSYICIYIYIVNTISTHNTKRPRFLQIHVDYHLVKVQCFINFDKPDTSMHDNLLTIAYIIYIHTYTCLSKRHIS